MSADPASLDTTPQVPVGRAAADFLLRFHPKGAVLVSAIDPEKKAPIVNDAFVNNRADHIAAWVDKYNGRRNLYFSAALPKSVCKTRLAKADVRSVPGVWVDVDFDKDQPIEGQEAKLRALADGEGWPDDVPKPSVCVWSGGGLQMFWLFEEPYALGDAAFVEGRSEWLRDRFRACGFCADGVQSVEHIFRIPFTTNLPDAKKREHGRTEVPSELLWFDDVRFRPEEFSMAEPGRDSHLATPSATVASGEAAKIASVDDLDLWNVPDRVRVVIVQGSDPDNPKPGDNSRSGWLFDVCCNLVRCGVPDEVVLGVITDPDFGISASVLDKGRASRRYALRNIESAKAKVLWEFQRPGEGKPPTKNLHNARLAVLKLGVVTEFDEFRKKLLLGGHELSETAAPITDRALSHLRQLILYRFGFDPGKELLDDAVRQLCFENPFDPVLDYLGGLAWDGERRIDDWLPRYMGAPDTDYARAVGRLSLVAAVRRARRPGCKFDTIVVLEGPQGSGKSSALAILAGHPDFFSDQDILAVDPKQQAELMEGVWLYEIAELEGMSRAETSKVKAFASRQVDRARPAYGRHREDNPRRCVFVGTCNESHYLKDRTGNRRFLPVETNEIDLAGLRRDRDQLWAEAAAAEAEGESIELPRSLWSVAAEIQEERVEVDPWQARLHGLTEPEYPFEGMPKGLVVHDGELRIFTGDVLHWLGVVTDRQHVGHAKRLAPLMRKLGWEGPRVMRIGTVTDRGYRKRRESCGSPEVTATPESQTEIDL